jgi:hypothetical protein
MISALRNQRENHGFSKKIPPGCKPPGPPEIFDPEGGIKLTPHRKKVRIFSVFQPVRNYLVKICISNSQIKRRHRWLLK